jgi:hypothetical protein
LETKWGIIQNDLFKIIGKFEAIKAFQEINANHENIVHKALKFYKAN